MLKFDTYSLGDNIWLENHINAMYTVLETRLQEVSNDDYMLNSITEPEMTIV